ncbi:MAG TPA: ADOP family duplicated permease, partial [Terriglobales bacterium]
PEKIDAAWCSWDFFATLGVTPALGRGFAPDDDKPGAPATAMLTDGVWRRRFDADPAAVGKTVWLDAAPYTIVGVLPASFVYESGKGGSAAQVWTPAGREYGAGLTSIFDDHQFVAVGRLAPSVTLPELVSRLNAVQRGVKASHPAPAVHDAVIGRSLLDDAVSDYRTPLYSLLAAAGCVLLIACMNLAGLMLARHAARSQEIAVRAALGASRTRLLRERVMECLWLAAAGAALGLALARLSLGWLVRARPDLNRIDAVRLDAGTVWFTLAVMAACALLTGVASSLRTGDASLAGVLRGGRQPKGGGRGHDGLRRGLVAAEVGCTVVLLIGAGLLLKSYQRLRSVDLGVPIDHALTMQISLPDAHYSQAGQRVGFFERLLAQLRATPGVSGAGLVTTAPGQGWGGDILVSVVEHPVAPKGNSLDLQTRAADPGYFAAVGLPLLRGRLFTSAERLDKSRVVVISASAVKLCFPGENPIGRHVKGESSGISYEVVGVVGDARWRVDLTPKPTMYLPLYNNTTSAATIVVHSRGRAEAMAVAAQQLISGMDPDLPVSDVRTLRETVGRAALGAQINSLLVLAFALIALLLAAAGLYGVLAYLVTQRTAEIGVRIALGARRGQLLRTVLWDGLRPAVIGLACGLVASVAAVRLIASMLFNTPPLDTAVFAAVAAALLIVATIACLMPAWRASRLSPLTALRAG